MYLGIDIGTSGIRLVVINDNEEIMAQLFGQYQQIDEADQEQAISQDPMVWWKLFLLLLEQLNHQVPLKIIQKICIDGTSGTVLLLDHLHRPIGKALMYHHSQAVEEAKQIKNFAPGDFPFASAESTLAKILWLIKHHQAYSNVYFCNQADWFYYQLSQQYLISDTNNVLKMGYDVKNACWPQWFDQLRISSLQLPKVFQPGRLLPYKHSNLEQFGFSKEVRLVAGTTDSTAAIYASRAAQPGDAITSLGSTLVTKVVSTKPINRREYGIYSQPFGQYWLIGGGSNSGGKVIKHFFTPSQMKAYTSMIRPDKLLNLSYYPLLEKGERFPENNRHKEPKLEPRPEQDHQFFQAILEGIADIEAASYQKLMRLGGPKINRVITMGGGACNRQWQQIRQDKLGVLCCKAKQTEAAYGAALLAKSSAPRCHSD